MKINQYEYTVALVTLENGVTNCTLRSGIVVAENEDKARLKLSSKYLTFTYHYSEINMTLINAYSRITRAEKIVSLYQFYKSP